VKKIPCILIIGLCLWLLLPAFSSAAEAKLTDPLPIETMKVAVYTKAFAKRFVLPDPEPGTEPSGAIQGMEFRVRHHRIMAGYSCELILYLDNTLPIAWPEDARASVSGIPTQDTLLMSNVPRERFLAMSVEDRRYSGERSSRYGRLVRLSTPDYQRLKQGGSLDVTIREYDKSFFPGLAYLKLDIGCTMTGTQLERFLQYGKGVELWFRRPEGKDYRQYPVIDATDFLRVPLPLPFLAHVLPWIKAGQDYNMVEAEARWKRERPERMKEAEQQMKEWDRELADPKVRRQVGDILNPKR